MAIVKANYRRIGAGGGSVAARSIASDYGDAKVETIEAMLAWLEDRELEHALHD